MQLYTISCSQNFYGQKDVKTYYKVPPHKVWAGCQFMVLHFGVAAVFVYLFQKDKPIHKGDYIGVFSAKYGNFRTANNQLHKTFNF